MKRAKPFPTGDLTPYLQAYVVTLESGAVVLARVMGPDRPQAQQAARTAALQALPGDAIWDSAAYPVGPDERAKGPGLDMLKGGQPPTGKTCKSCKFWGRYRAGECDREGGQFPDNPAASFESVARVLDDSGLTVGLVTGPDFGCVHHAAKKGGR